MARGIFVDTSPLKHSRDFRLLFVASLISTLGNQLTLVAVNFQVFHQTNSSFQVGLISVAQLIPLIAGSLIGGSVGDKVDRRQIMVVSTALLAITSLALTLNTFAWGTNLAALYVILMIAAFLTGFTNPARSAAIPNLVPKEHLVAAFSFNQIVLQFGGLAGPALGGVIIAIVGFGWTYAIDATTFAIAFVLYLGLKAIPPQGSATRPGLKSIVEGFSFLRGRPVIQGVYLADLAAMIFGMPRALFPAMAVSVYHGGPVLYGLLSSAPAAGALVGAVTTGWVEGIIRRGRAVCIAVIVWGGAIAVFGLTSIAWVGLAMLAVAGWADVISAVLRNTILQTSIPDEFRSRLSSIQMAVVQGGPKLGDFESGAVAAVTSTEFSVVSGGLLCIAGIGLLVLWRPQFWREQATDTVI